MFINRNGRAVCPWCIAELLNGEKLCPRCSHQTDTLPICCNCVQCKVDRELARFINTFDLVDDSLRHSAALAEAQRQSIQLAPPDGKGGNDA